MGFLPSLCSGSEHPNGPAFRRYRQTGSKGRFFRLRIKSRRRKDRQAGIGISRTALYRFEKGEVVKIETLEKLAVCSKVSLPTLLGVGVEYLPSARDLFRADASDRRDGASSIIVLAGRSRIPLASEAFDAGAGRDVFVRLHSDERNPEDRERALTEIDEIMTILHRAQGELSQAPARHRQPDRRVGDRARFNPTAWSGRHDLPGEELREQQHKLARAELQSISRALMEEEPIGVRIGIVPGKSAAYRLCRSSASLTGNCWRSEPVPSWRGAEISASALP